MKSNKIMKQPIKKAQYSKRKKKNPIDPNANQLTKLHNSHLVAVWNNVVEIVRIVVDELVVCHVNIVVTVESKSVGGLTIFIVIFVAAIKVIVLDRNGEERQRVTVRTEERQRECEWQWERFGFFLINTNRVWIISIPYPVKLYPWKTGYYPKHLDRVGLDIHYPMGMTIPNCNDYYMGIGISITRNTLQVINCEKDIRKSRSTNPNKTH